MNKRFRIIITEEVFEDRPGGNEWKETGESSPKFDYTPEIIVKKKVQRDIYTQDTEELDLCAVIRAVNNL